MQRYTNTSLIVILLGLAILWAGCGGPAKVPAGTTTPTEKPTSAEPTSIAVPQWFLNIPEDPNYSYATASGTSMDLQLALDNAKHGGWLEIASQLETRISGLFKRFRKEVGAGEDSKLLSVTTSVSRAVVSQVVQRARTARQDVKKEGHLYRAYVLMEMPVGEANAALMAKIKENENIYTRFRASKGFKELEAEVEEYEKWKKEREHGGERERF